jgi:Na+-translocating ferredoxin:NAD+ oxidoreductase subunit B
MPDIYQRMAKYLDRLPAGFPPAPDGTELKLLRKLFTPQEAGLFMHLSLLGESARVVAFRARLPLAQVTSMLDEMAAKGLVSSNVQPGQKTLYSVNQYVVGFYEEQVNHLDRELVELTEEYGPVYFEDGPWTRVPQMRTIPIRESIPVEHAVMPYERAEDIVRAHTRFAVRNCICRQERQLMGQGCDKPVEVCLSFDNGAEQSVLAGRGRMISMDEALDIFKQADRAGLVLQPSNSKDPVFICACCGCCCGVLRGIKRFDKPADLVVNPFIARHDPALCSTCEACIERCQMEALTLVDGVISFKAERCIGCGLCVSTCPSGAMSLVRKAEPPSIPKNTVSTYLQMAQARNKLGLLRMAAMLVRSKVDRVLAAIF